VRLAVGGCYGEVPPRSTCNPRTPDKLLRRRKQGLVLPIWMIRPPSLITRAAALLAMTTARMFTATVRSNSSIGKSFEHCSVQNLELNVRFFPYRADPISGVMALRTLASGALSSKITAFP